MYYAVLYYTILYCTIQYMPLATHSTISPPRSSCCCLPGSQIQIPPQTEEVHWLHFSPVEGHFYRRQHEVCSHDALAKLRKISDWTLKLGSLDRRSVSAFLYPLLRLRQACCHPQAVRGEFLPFQKR